MSSKYKIRKKALMDLEKIWLYTFNHWGVEQADDYVRLITDKFEWLAENPKAGQPRHEIKSGYLSALAGSHLIFYKLTRHQPDIVSVIHQKADISSRVGSPKEKFLP
ncbi:type II toxin-antitoxin system RelE/ParE family toxin [Endozoicomonas sp. ALD040]|uniref:type II toxin-antitoxin system RelE/ParE family toxin n=1 Tax=unclassified Endozoicomonas TaxID=2644528 RepID=UPI003BAFB39B